VHHVGILYDHISLSVPNNCKVSLSQWYRNTKNILAVPLLELESVVFYNLLCYSVVLSSNTLFPTTHAAFCFTDTMYYVYTYSNVRKLLKMLENAEYFRKRFTLLRYKMSDTPLRDTDQR